jgi:hypothetical protein
MSSFHNLFLQRKSCVDLKEYGPGQLFPDGCETTSWMIIHRKSHPTIALSADALDSSHVKVTCATGSDNSS